MFKIATDSTNDLPKSYYEENNIKVMHLSCIIDGIIYGKDKEITDKALYDAIRAGKMPTTSQVNIDEAETYFEEILNEEPDTKEILYIAFSSGLSGTYNNVSVAAQNIMEKHEGLKIAVVDSLAASIGEGLLTYWCVELRKQGKSFEEVRDWLEANKLHAVHVFTVDDLNHLHRGGRVSKTAAIAGTIIGIKPMMHVDNEGKLVVLNKARGRRKALISLITYMEEHVGDNINDDTMVMISHSDCIDDAMFVKEQVEKRFGIKKFMINMVGPVIGSHTGCGTVTLMFMGNDR